MLKRSCFQFSLSRVASVECLSGSRWRGIVQFKKKKKRGRKSEDCGQKQKLQEVRWAHRNEEHATNQYFGKSLFHWAHTRRTQHITTRKIDEKNYKFSFFGLDLVRRTKWLVRQSLIGGQWFESGLGRLGHPEAEMGTWFFFLEMGKEKHQTQFWLHRPLVCRQVSENIDTSAIYPRCLHCVLHGIVGLPLYRPYSISTGDRPSILILIKRLTRWIPLKLFCHDFQVFKRLTVFRPTSFNQAVSWKLVIIRMIWLHFHKCFHAWL